MVSFAKIPDLVGYLVLTEYGAVLESDGELKNDENCANIVASIINLADRYIQAFISNGCLQATRDFFSSDCHLFFYSLILNGRRIQCGCKYIAEKCLPEDRGGV